MNNTKKQCFDRLLDALEGRPWLSHPPTQVALIALQHGHVEAGYSVPAFARIRILLLRRIVSLKPTTLVFPVVSVLPVYTTYMLAHLQALENPGLIFLSETEAPNTPFFSQPCNNNTSQVEYAMEAVKQGGASLGLRSGSQVVLAALKRAPNEMSAPQKKIFKLDSNMGVAIAGLTADARSLAKYMRTECLNHK